MGPDCCQLCRTLVGATHAGVPRREAAAHTGCAECGKALAVDLGIGVLLAFILSYLDPCCDVMTSLFYLV